MKTKLLQLLAVSFVFTGCATVPDDIAPDDFTRGAYRQIQNETVWIDGAVYGFAGELENRTATAVRFLLSQENADAIFLRLLTDAKPAGQLYALCGLYYVDRERFDKEVEAFRHDTREIETTSADVTGRDKLCDIVFCPFEDSQTERIVLKRGESLQQWFLAHKGEMGYGDISGGADPERIVNPNFGEE